MSFVYTNNGKTVTDCPICGQEVKITRRGSGFLFERRGGHSDGELRPQLPADVMLELARSSNGNHGRLALVRAAQVDPIPIRWTWHKRIPDKAVTLLARREGTGKSTLTALLAADLTSGRLVGNLHGQPVNVIIATLEDPAASVAAPRLIAAGPTGTRPLPTARRRRDGAAVDP